MMWVQNCFLNGKPATVSLADGISVFTQQQLPLAVWMFTGLISVVAVAVVAGYNSTPRKTILKKYEILIPSGKSPWNGFTAQYKNKYIVARPGPPVF